ncbi:MAG: prenyltransferase/squalene oxidase repeat-containing protein [Candidatus Liptonbacteria bacterium]|nr:prenyltransferase/squalene oxidase repeat-containing protein [Candidatus Liptonbacteria bacterium]
MKNIFNTSRFLFGSLIAFALFMAISAPHTFAAGPVITTTDITAEAASSTGAIVTFSVNATTTNVSSTSLTVSCTPPSGSLFALSTTTVTCVVNDGIATSTATFNVSVVDTTPPSITAPADQSFTATGASTTPTLIKATSTDLVDLNPAISYSPNSFSLGTTTVTWTAMDASGNTATTTSNVFIASASQATLAIRDGSALVGPFTVTLPDANASSVLIAPTVSTTTYAVPARSVLALLESADTATSSFDITDLQYFSSFNSFLVNCIFVPAASAAPDCFNWTYAVNGSFPFFGMDGYILQDGDTAYIFFGSQLQVSVDKASVSTVESFTVTARKYDPPSGAYVPASGEIVGAVQFDSNFTATEFATSTTDANGHATLSLASVGAYSVGIASGGYFPNTPITVSAPQPVISVSGGHSGGISITHHTIDVDKAIQFLSARQKPNGSFGADLYTDWAAIALAAGPNNSNKDKIMSYLKSAPNTGVSVTDYERRAIALMSLGINPYSGTDTNYIKKIVDSFDGAQIGDTSLVNDDIFAVFPLIKSGYAESDPMMQKVIAFIISKQRSDGSWEGSVDMTAAAIQSLSLFPSATGVSQAQTRAKDYLLRSQQSNGGFGGDGSFSTSWVLQAIVALSEPASLWTQGNNNPNDYLFSFQQSDGGIEPLTIDESTRVWATAYAIPATLGKTWSSILSSFAKPTATAPGGGGLSGNIVAATSSSPLLFPTSENSTTAASTTLIALIATTTTQASSVLPAVPTSESGRKNSSDNSVPLPKSRSSAIRIINYEASSTGSVSSSDNLPTVSGQGREPNLAMVESGAVIENLKNIGTAIIHGVYSLVSNVFSIFWRW